MTVSGGRRLHSDLVHGESLLTHDAGHRTKHKSCHHRPHMRFSHPSSFLRLKFYRAAALLRARSAMFQCILTS